MAKQHRELTHQKINDLLLNVTDFESMVHELTYRPPDAYRWIEYLPNNSFRARVRISGKLIRFGIYPTMEGAAKVVQWELLALVRELRSRIKQRPKPKRPPKRLSAAQIRGALKSCTSFLKMLQHHEADTLRRDSTTKNKGVRFNYMTDRYSTSITVAGKNFYLGTYTSEIEAVTAVRSAREKVIKILKQRVNLTGESGK